MTPSFLARRSIFGAPNALLILLAVFFLVPFAFRGARFSLETNENAVKDWLPSDFRETKELEWFSQYFYGERFIIATWDGATEDSQRLSTLATKLQKESLSEREKNADDYRAKYGDWDRVQKLTSKLGLLMPSNQHYDWGGLKEKWFFSTTGDWYYLTPDGSLFRWNGGSDSVSGVKRSVIRLVKGPHVNGKFITAIGKNRPGVDKSTDPGLVNEYYNNPAIMAAPLFATVQTGPEMVAELSREGGATWPISTMAPEFKAPIARRRALEQLTGLLYAPAVARDFDWAPESFLNAYPEGERSSLPDDIEDQIAAALAEIVDKRFNGNIVNLKATAQAIRANVWYDVFEAVGVEPPPRQTGLLLTLTDVGRDHLPFSVGRGVLGEPQGRLYQLAEESGLSPPPPPVMVPPPFDRLVAETPAPGPTMHVGGPPIDNVSIDEEGSITLVRLVGYCAALGLFLSYVCFRSFKITIMIFFVGVVAAATSLSLVWWTGATVDAILMSMPSLVYVLGLSAAIHIVNYYREEVEAGGVEGAPIRALAHGWGPCTLASITTAIGLMSLYTSNIIPIRKFGLYSAIGVIATLALLFAYLPAALEVFVPRFATKWKPASNKRGSKSTEKRAGVGVLADKWESFGRWVVSHYRLVTVACLMLFVGTAFGLPKIKTSVQLLKLFGPESRIIEDYAWLEEHYAKLVPMELVLRVPPAMQAESDRFAEDPTLDKQHALSRLERIEAVGQIERTLDRAFGELGLGIAGKAMSAATLIQDAPQGAARIAAGGLIRDNLSSLQENDLLEIETDGPMAGSELYRISLRVGAFSDVNYGHFVRQLRSSVEPILAAYETRDQVLDAIAAASNDDRNKKPLLVVATEPRSRLGSESLLIAKGKPQSVGHNSPSIVDQYELNQPLIYRSALGELLSSLNVKVSWGSASKLSPLKEDPDKLRSVMSRFCGVVVVGDSEAFAYKDLPDEVGFVVDARRTEFDQSSVEIVDGVPVVNDSGPLQVVYTGVIPVVYKAQNTLMTSLVDSIAWAFVLIAAVMIVLLNPGRPVLGMLHPRAIGFGIGAGAVAMLPNVFPVIVIFGSMGHLGTLVDIGTMMTASVAMGVAVDDTIHFLSWLRRGLDSGLDRKEALIQTYRRVGPAMTQTTVVGGLGLFVFALSTFTPTQRFGTLMLVLLAAALVGDLIFLPALLAGPLGKLFKARPHHSDHASDSNLKPAEAEVPASAEEDLDQPAALDSTAASQGNRIARSSHPEALQGRAPSPKFIRKDNPHVRKSDLE